ncbi:hypothetical protein KEM48_009849 [Puccinia striiformis f. sp. tritici PST-130]|nr:hypothetical protein KEM48_009849 [Puccinia striiformis f. sp. tritici PST-130]
MLLSIRSILVLTIIACGFTAADLATDQKKKCTYGCGRANSAMREAGCALRVGRNEKTHQDSWLLKKGNPTEGHPGYYNCLGTGMNRPVCCLNKKIVYTPGFWLIYGNCFGIIFVKSSSSRRWSLTATASTHSNFYAMMLLISILHGATQPTANKRCVKCVLANEHLHKKNGTIDKIKTVVAVKHFRSSFIRIPTLVNSRLHV